MNRLEKTRAFLTEFIIVILFFTISAVITVRLFVEANKKSNDSINITKGNIMSETIIEELKTNISRDGINGAEYYMSEDESYIKEDTGLYYQYFDKEFNVVSKDDAYVLGKVVIKTDEKLQGNLYTVTVSFENTEKIICSIETKIYEGEAR